MKRMLFILLAISISILNAYSQKIIRQPILSIMPWIEKKLSFEDYHIFLFNYRGFVSPRQFSITQFTHVQFLPIAAEMYNFNLNFYDKGTERLIEDDVPV